METMLMEAIGMLGSFFLLSAWIYEAYRTIKRGDHLDVKFIGIYIVGLAILVYYSILINSVPYMILNGIILFLTILELDIALRRKGKTAAVDVKISVKARRK